MYERKQSIISGNVLQVEELKTKTKVTVEAKL